MYVCVHVYLYVRMCTCIPVCMYVYMYTCMYVRMCTCIPVCMYVCLHVYLYVRMCTCIPDWSVFSRNLVLGVNASVGGGEV